MRSLAPTELADDADIGRVAADEHQRFLAAIVAGQRLFQPAMHRALAGDMPACRAGNSVLVDRGLGRRDDSGWPFSPR